VFLTRVKIVVSRRKCQLRVTRPWRF